MATSALADAVRELLSGDGQEFGLSEAATCSAVHEIMEGTAEPVLVATLLTAFACRGVSNREIVGAVGAVRSWMTPLPIPASLRPILDTCGTGGDGANTVNVSTATALVVASCGVNVAKHGNRSASGNSGSAEVMTELGVNIEAPPRVLIRCLENVGITFLFAPRFHPALKQVAPIRRLLPFRTLFNLVGPLANPALPDFQLLGVPKPGLALIMAMALRQVSDLSSEIPRSAFVVSGANGLDEFSLSGKNLVHATNGTKLTVHDWGPAEFGLPKSGIEALRVDGPADSASRIRDLLAGEPGPIRDVVLANAAAGLMLVGKVDTLRDGVSLAAEAIDRGDAANLLTRWSTLSHQAD